MLKLFLGATCCWTLPPPEPGLPKRFQPPPRFSLRGGACVDGCADCWGRSLRIIEFPCGELPKPFRSTRGAVVWGLAFCDGTEGEPKRRKPALLLFSIPWTRPCAG